MGSNIVFKKMKLDISDSTFLRSIFQTGIFLLIVKIQGHTIWVWTVDENKNINMIRFLQVLQGAVSAVLLVSYLVAILLMEIGDAMAIYFSSFLSTMILSKIVLKERIGYYKTLCGMMILAGILLVLKPPLIMNEEKDNLAIEVNTTNQSTLISSENNNTSDIKREIYDKYPIGEIFAITSMLALSCLNIITTLLFKNSSTNSTELSVLYSGFGILLISFIVPFFDGNQWILFTTSNTTPYNTWEWISLVGVAIANVIMVFMRFLALKFVGATIENFIFTSEIVFGYVAQVVFFGAVPDTKSIIGSLLITFACAMVPFEEKITSCLKMSFQNYL